MARMQPSTMPVTPPDDDDSYDVTADSSTTRTRLPAMPVGPVRAAIDAQMHADPEVEAEKIMLDYPAQEQETKAGGGQILEHPEARAPRLLSGLTMAQAAFLISFRLIPSEPLAAMKSSVSISAVKDWRRQPVFRQAYADAYEAARGALFASMWISAVEGDVEAVYQGGLRVGYRRKFSDRMRELLAKAVIPEMFARKELAGAAPIVHIKATTEQIADVVRRLSPTRRNETVVVEQAQSQQAATQVREDEAKAT